MSAVFRAARTDFDRLYRRHVASVYRYAYAVLGNHADAEDVTQQTFLNAYRSISEGTKPRKAENWLLTIAHNEVRRHFRRAQGKPREVELDEQVPDVAPERVEPSVADVVRALQHLPPIQRSALVMREFEGRSYAEIAQILNVTQSALEALIFRARRALAEQLEGELTCTEAEQALSRRLDGRLPRRESRRLKAHLRECRLCVRFADVQKSQRSLLKGFSVMPIPASLFLFRGEQAAAACVGASAVAAGGSTAVASGGFAGFATAFAVKAAAVTATVSVAGGVGYGVATRHDVEPQPGREVAQAAPLAQNPHSQWAARLASSRPHGNHTRRAPARISRSQRKAGKALTANLPRRTKKVGNAEKIAVKVRRGHQKPSLVTGRSTPKVSAKPKGPAPRMRPERARRLGHTRRQNAKPSKPTRTHAPKPPPPSDPAPPAKTSGRGPKT